MPSETRCRVPTSLLKWKATAILGLSRLSTSPSSSGRVHHRLATAGAAGVVVRDPRPGRVGRLVDAQVDARGGLEQEPPEERQGLGPATHSRTDPAGGGIT